MSKKVLLIFVGVVLVGCNLPTSPENGHSAAVVTSSASVTVGRRHAVEPDGHRLTPPCSAAAPLFLARPQDQRPGYLFRYRDGNDPKAVTAELAATYGFTPIFIYTLVPGFAAVVSEQALAAMRCDSRIESVEGNAFFYLAN